MSKDEPISFLLGIWNWSQEGPSVRLTGTVRYKLRVAIFHVYLKNRENSSLVRKSIANAQRRA